MSQQASGNTTGANGAKRPTLTRADWNQRYAASNFIWSVLANQFLVSESQNLAGGRALDLACGEGRNAVWLAEKGWQVHAVDFAEVAADKGRRLAEHRKVGNAVRFEVADLLEFTPAPAQYDLVAMVYLQMPLPDLAGVLVKAAAALAPGGTLLLVGHDCENLSRGFGGPQDANLLYTAAQIAGVIEDKLAIEKAERIERHIDTANGPKVAIDCLVRAKRLR